MAVQIPDFTTLGNVATQPSTTLGRFDQASPWAAAEERLGGGLEAAGRSAETVGAYRLMAQHHMNAASADADFANTVTALGEKIRTATDPDQVAALGAQYRGAADHAAQAFADPAAARLWSARKAAVVAQGEADAALRQTELRRASYNATIRGQLDDATRLGASAADPQAFPTALTTIGRLTDAAAQAGAMTPVEAYTAGRQATRQLIGGRVETLTQQNQPQQALALLDQHVGDLDPYTVINLRGQAQRVQERLGVAAATDDIWSRWGGAGASAAPGALPQQIAAAASGAGVDPVTALTTAQIESGMGANLGSRGNIFQLGDKEWQAAGGGDMADLPTQVKNGVSWLSKTQATLKGALGREPDPAELYLGHQQGSAAGAALLQHPEANAIATVRPFHPSDAEARRAIVANGGTADMSAGDFTAKWQHTFDQTAQRFQSFGTSDVDEGGASGAGAGGAAGAASANQDAGANQNSPMPDLNGMLAQLQGRVESGALTPEQGGAIEAGLRARFNRLAAAEAGQRAALVTRLNDGAAQLAAGGQFDYDPADIRHLLPPDNAAQWLTKLGDAKAQGQASVSVRDASPDQIAAQRATLSAGLDRPDAPDFQRRAAVLGTFEKAVTQRNRQLAADPAQYLIANSPAVAAAATAIDPAKPRSFQDFATATLAEQARLGVDPVQQHVLAKSGAVKLAGALAADPEHAPATLQAMQAQWGGAWPKVWHDMVTLGGLPPAYEAVGTLKSPQDASLLARALAEPLDAGKTLADRVGPQPYNQMKQYIRADGDVDSFYRALMNTPLVGSARAGQLLDTIDTLAAARANYLGETPTVAADNAIKAFTGQYSFALPGAPAVPSDKAGAVSANAAATLAGLTPDNIAVPALFGASPALPSKQDYVDRVRAAPTWVNNTTGDGLWLMDNVPGQAPRIVRQANGQPLSVPFDAAMPADPALGAAPAPGAGEPGDAGSFGEGQE